MEATPPPVPTATACEPEAAAPAADPALVRGERATSPAASADVAETASKRRMSNLGISPHG
jgi:hypothetical protein